MRSLLYAMLLISSPLFAQHTYYISTSGSDSNTSTQAQSKATPWLHAPGMTGCTGACNTYSPVPGDHFILKGGDTWHTSTGSPLGLPWTFSSSGTSGNNIYIGVDQTWFDGASWSRPILTMDNPTSTTILAANSCTFDDTTKVGVRLSGSFVTFDNFEFTGKCWNGNPFSGSLVISTGTNLLIEHNYFHGWSASSGSVDTHYMILGITTATTTNNEIAFNVIDGSDTFHGTTSGQCPGTFNGAPCSIGFGIFGDIYNIHHNILNNLSNGMVGNNLHTIHDNLFENMWNSYDTTTHPNVIESGAGALVGVPLYFYNNVLKNTHQNVTYWPMFDTDAYEFNNLFFQNDDGGGGANVNCFMQSPATTSSTPTAHIYNNTLVGDSSTCNFNFFQGNGATPTWKGTAIYENNHFITSVATLAGLISCPNPSICTNTDNGHEVFQTVAIANGQGYVAGNGYQPTLGTNSTVGAAANLTSACSTFSTDSALCSGTSQGVTEGPNNTAVSPAIAIVSRPSVAAWNSGAYQLTTSTWFVRSDGGTRFSSNVPTGQCNGKFDAPYPGSGTNQNCAYKDFRYTWDDDSGVVGPGTWQPAGGDTVVIRGCTANANQVYPSNPNCRIGWDGPFGTAGVNDWCRGVGNNICTNPTITAGTSGAHTKIMSGWAFDHPGQPVSDANKIQLFGGYGLQLGTFNLAGTQWLDLIGIELTTHNQVSSGNAGFPGNCTKGGSPAFPVDCQGGTQPYDDYAQNGFVTSNTSANISFTDVKVHGFNASGFWGPIGGPITMTRVSSNNNGFAGWNFADQSDTPNAAGSSITASFVTMNSNGCYEQYPIVSALPLRACYDSNSGGFGDAWSGQDTLMDTFICDHCTMNYNTKDAFIGPHAQVKNLTVTNSVAIGNMGAQMKYGTQQFATTLFQNNLFVMNCYRQQETLPGAPQNFNQSTGLGGSYLTNFCRAGGDGWAFLTRANSTAHFYGNTIVGANSTMMDINCGFVDTGGVHEETNCGTSPLLWTDNNMIGYTPPENGGQSPGLWFFDPGAGGSLVLTADHNNYFGVRNTSPDVCGVNNITCANPLMVTQPVQPWPGTEAALDVYNANPGSSFTPINTSPLALAGRQLTGLNTDFYGATRTIPPAIGGVNANGSGPPPPTLTSITVTPNPGSVLVGSTLPMGCTSTFSDSTTAPCTSPTWTTSGAHTTINVTSGVVTGVSAGADTIAAAIGSIHGGAIVNVTAIIPPPKGSVSGRFSISGACTGVCP